MIIKDIKSATLWGVMLWVLIFVVFSVIMFAPQLKDNVQMQTIIELLVLPVLVAFSTYMYFKGTIIPSKDGKLLQAKPEEPRAKRQDFKTSLKKPTIKDGAILGAYFIVIGTVLDLIITVPLFVKSYTTFYTQWSLWVGFLETIIFAAVAAYYLGKKKK